MLKNKLKKVRQFEIVIFYKFLLAKIFLLKNKLKIKKQIKLNNSKS
jgi:hypothetical protein